LRERTDDDPPASPETGPGSISGYDDSRGHVGDMEFYDLATQFLERFPKMAQLYTKPEIASALATLGLAGTTPTRTHPTWPLDQQIRVTQDSVNMAAKEKTNRWMRERFGTRYDAHAFAELSKTIFTLAYRRVGIPMGVRLPQIKNLETLTRLRQVIDALPEQPSDA